MGGAYHATCTVGCWPVACTVKSSLLRGDVRLVQGQALQGGVASQHGCSGCEPIFRPPTHACALWHRCPLATLLFSSPLFPHTTALDLCSSSLPTYAADGEHVQIGWQRGKVDDAVHTLFAEHRLRSLGDGHLRTIPPLIWVPNSPFTAVNSCSPAPLLRKFRP